MIQAVILAGGRGVRLGKITKKIPKPMVKIGKLPILEHQINLLKKYGIKNIIILTGHFSDVIKNHFGSGNKFGVKIKYFGTEKRLGTAGRAKLAQKELKKDFILLYGDVMMNICLKGLINFHKKKKAFCTLTVQPSDHSYDADLIELDEEQRIVKIHPKPHAAEKYFQNLINAGACIISPKIFKCVKIKRNKEVDFCRDIFPKIIKREKLFGYFTPEYMQDAGTPTRLKAVIKNHLSGKIKRLNLENKRSAIFIDRDGTINYDTHHLSDIRRFKIFPSTIKAIKLINSSEYLAIIITNQSTIARGLLTIRGLNEIHKKLETLLGKEGAKIDKILFCPHHPEIAYPKKNLKYKKQCECRKPGIGMIEEAEKLFNIDLKKSWVIGDSKTDILTGINAGTKTILVKKNQKKFQKCPFPTKKKNDLYSAVKFILKQKIK